LKATEETTVASEGLFVSLKNLTATLIALIYTRLDLISTDLEEGRERMLSLLVVTFVSLFCLCIGALLLAMMIVVVFWDTHRLVALGSLTGVFLVAGLILCRIAIRELRAMPRMFAASLTELSKDQQQLESRP
jgi:uncharacterized membrane protein YqjE